MRGVWVCTCAFLLTTVGAAAMGVPNESATLVPEGTVPTEVSGTASDGHVIHVRYWPLASQGQTGAPDVRPFNLAPDILRWSLEHYETFLSWGFELDEKLPHTNVTIDQPTTASACTVACADDKHIWLSSQSPLITRVYNDLAPDQYFQKVLGHEWFHVVQTSVVDPAITTDPLVEGTARLQETLHGYSSFMHQETSILYAQDKQGCNGYDAYLQERNINAGNQATLSDMDLGMQIGPFTHLGDMVLHSRDVGPSHGYDACYFWLSWYAHHGVGPLVTFVENGNGVGAPRFDRIRTSIEAATGEPIVHDLARFAMMSLTGRGYSWGPATGTGPILDWGEHLDRWAPAALMPGEHATIHIQDGGMMARQIGAPGELVLEGEQVMGYVVRDDGTDATLAPVASGSHVSPGSGETVWAVLIRPHSGGADATLALR